VALFRGLFRVWGSSFQRREGRKTMAPTRSAHGAHPSRAPTKPVPGDLDYNTRRGTCHALTPMGFLGAGERAVRKRSPTYRAREIGSGPLGFLACLRDLLSSGKLNGNRFVSLCPDLERRRQPTSAGEWVGLGVWQGSDWEKVKRLGVLPGVRFSRDPQNTQDESRCLQGRRATG
jgi:hypothetical protein